MVREDDAALFYFPYTQPSTPSDVLTDCLKRVSVGGGEKDEALYSLSVQGTVDDSALVKMAGQSVQSGSGAGVPISGEFSDIAAGVYEVYVKHTNIAYPEKQNASFLTCTVGAGAPVTVVTPEPPINQPPPYTDPCDESSSGDGDTPPGGGGGGEQRAARVGASADKRSSTSGGRGVRRSSGANEMSWSAQFGVFRGLAGMPTGVLSIACYEAYKPELGQPAGLRWQHPLASSLALPAGGMAPNRMVELWEGHGIINFLLDGTGARFFKIGASVASNTELAPVREMSREPGVVCHIAEASFIRASYPSGAASFYDLEEGRCVGYISAADLLIDAEQAYAYIAIVRDEESGDIRQIWNAWDGLADIVPGEEEGSGYAIRIYPPAQVTAPAEEGELYTVTGDPVKTFTISSDDAAQSLTIRERDHTLPESYGEMVTTWRWASGAWSQQEGEGEDAVITERVREDEEDGAHYSVIVRQMKGEVAATCTREEYVRGAAGNLLLSSTAGYGEPGALTTTYIYNTAGQLTERHEPGGGVYKTIYDELGRVREESSPWSDGLSRTVQTTYRSDAPYSKEPARVCTTYFNGSSNPTMLNEEYTYKVQNNVKRVEKRVTAAGLSGTKFSVEETWLESAPNTFAAGRPKMRRDVNGVQTFYTYTATEQYGALYSVTEETRVDTAPVPGQSTRKVSYVSSEGNTLREESYVLLSNGGWELTSGATHTYDALNRLIGTTWDNGRHMTRRLTCQGQILEETDADGITTHYTYNSARQLVETTRSAVYDGEVCITPETITEYERDGAGRVTRTTTYIGAMKTVTTTEYDLQGRVVKQVDELGRETLTAYSEDGLTTTITTPTGATLITTANPDGSVARQSGTGQRELRYKYDFYEGLRTFTYLADGETVLSIRRADGFGNTYLLRTATTRGNGIYVDTHSVYNDRILLVRQTQGALAPVEYEYDSMGQQSRVTELLDAAAPQDATKNRITTYTYGYEKGADGEVYRVTTTQRNNPAGEWLTGIQKTLVSQLSPTLASKQISIDERGHATTVWTEYGAGSERRIYQQIPTSNIVAEAVSFDGFTTRSKDNVGITTRATRTYREEGMLLTNTDGRGNTTTTKTDIAGRTIQVTDAAGDTTTTEYEAASNNPAVITDALGNTTCYAYDIRGQKIAEWGTAVQPATYEYDDDGNLTALTTWRVDEETISTDPRGMTGGDTTRWAYNAATGLELSITYADGRSTTKTYDTANRLATVTTARGITTLYTYNEKTGLITAIGFSAPDTTRQQYTYNILGQPTEITDAAGTRTLTYDRYGKADLEQFSFLAIGYTLQDQWDAYGRSIGYQLIRNDTQLCAAVTGYAADGRIGSAGFIYGGQEKQFRYTYLPGSDLISGISMPNGMQLTQSYEEKRDLLATMAYTRGTTLVTQRQYTYDALGRPTDRQTSYPQKGQGHADAFGYNDRSELTSATLDGAPYTYAYDNIGNRITAQEAAEEITYTANELNQYTDITTNGDLFEPEYDEDGNQTKVKTATGVWHVTYNAENRAVKFESEDGAIIITCAYDYMGRRIWKKVEQNGATTLHEGYIYHGYLQIACVNLQKPYQAAERYITWDPTQPTATRPLTLQQNSVWYTYGWDLTKNICELYNNTGYILNLYSYTPYGTVTAEGDVTQPLQWSSENHDVDLGLVYYNYRYYNPADGRWTRRDPEGENIGYNMYLLLEDLPTNNTDYIGLCGNDQCNSDCSQKCGGASRCRKDDYGCCEKRTQEENPNYTAEANGCGAKGTGWLVPDFDFTEACNSHDLCYGKCGSSKYYCDKKFLKDMINICKKKYRGSKKSFLSPSRAGRSRKKCLALAHIYYGAVKEYGNSAFQKTQDEACLWKKC